jgi:transposase-like protein
VARELAVVPGARRARVARSYTPSQKAEVLEHAGAHGVTAAAEKFGISRFSIYDWQRKTAKASKGEGPSPTSGPSPQDIELRQAQQVFDTAVSTTGADHYERLWVGLIRPLRGNAEMPPISIRAVQPVPAPAESCVENLELLAAQRMEGVGNTKPLIHPVHTGCRWQTSLSAARAAASAARVEVAG